MAILNKVFTNCLNSSDTQIFQYNDLLFVPGSIISQNGNCYRDTQVTSDLVATLSIKSSGFTNCQECLQTTMTGLVVSGCSGGTFMYITIPNTEIPPIGYSILYNSTCWTVVSATTEFINVQSNIPSFEDCETCNLFGTTVERSGGGSTTNPGDPGDPGGGGGGGPYLPNWETTQFVQCCDNSISRWYEIDINSSAWGSIGSQVHYDFTNQVFWKRTNVICNPPYQNCISYGQLYFIYGNSCGNLVQCPTPSPTATPTTTPLQYSYWGSSLLFDATPPSFVDSCGQWNLGGNYYGFKPFNLLGVNDYLYSGQSRDFNVRVQGGTNMVLPLASNNSRTDTKYFRVSNLGRIVSIVNCTPVVFYSYKVAQLQVLNTYFNSAQDACNFQDPLNVWTTIYGLNPIDQLIVGDVLYYTDNFSVPLTSYYWPADTYKPMYAWNSSTNTIVGPKYVVRIAAGGNGAIQSINTCDSLFPPFTPTPTPSPTGCIVPGIVVTCTSYQLFANGNSQVDFQYDRCTNVGIDYGLVISVGAYSNVFVCSSSYPTFISGGPYGISPLLNCNRICIDPTPTPTITQTNTSTPTVTISPTVSPSITPSNTQTGTPPPSGTNYVTPSPTTTPTQTPTQTITNSITPTQTITNTSTVTSTPVITPSNTPSGTRNATTTTTRPLGIEECRVITVEPMGVTCNVINATIPGTLSTAQLIITGGTPPYSTLWDHGINPPQNPILNNLTNGIYSATVTDFFQDYRVKVFCVVTGASITVTSTPTVTPTQTETRTPGSTPSVTTSPTFTPSPTVTSISRLCATFNIVDSNNIQRFEQYQFYYNTQINGTNSWTADTTQNYLTNTGSLILNYQSTPNSTIWYISQVTNPNNIQWPFTIQTYAGINTLPTGQWFFNGNTTYVDSFGRRNQIFGLQITTGLCSVPPLSANITVVDATCPGLFDGSVTITTYGGTPPYSYSLDNTNYTPNNTITNLSNGSFTAYVKDSAGTPQIFSQNFNIGTIYSQPQPTNLSFTRTQFIQGSNNNQSTIIDEFSQYELNLNGLVSGVNLSTFDLNLSIENITKAPGVSNANGTTVTVSWNNQTVFTTGITPSTLWTETSTQPRGNVACSNELVTTQKILVPNRFSSSVPIRIAAFANRGLINSDTVVVTISNKAQITSASTQLNCPTELTNIITLTSSYTVAGPNQVCFPIIGNPSITTTAFRSATQTSSNTYTGSWRVQVTSQATCIQVTSVKSSGMIGSASLRFDCNDQSGSSPFPFTATEVSPGQVSIVSPPNSVSCNNLIPYVNPETFTITYFVTNTCTQCGGTYELSLSVNNTSVFVTQTISMIPGIGSIVIPNVIINSNSNVTIIISCII